MIWIVSGPSSAGKSTLIASERRGDVLGAPPSAPVVFPATSHRLLGEPPHDAVYHYNILRHLDALWSAGEPIEERCYSRFDSDPPWADALRAPGPKEAVVLVVSRGVLRERTAARLFVEPAALETAAAAYPNDHWQELLARIGLRALYRAWCDELRRHRIPFRLIDSSDHAYRPLPPAALAATDLD